MNERIRQLAEQARIKDHWSMDERRYLTNYLDENKFAELIVRECIGIVEKNESEMHYDNGMYPVHPTVCEIREHFGVEE
jgi:hypothetical protein